MATTNTDEILRQTDWDDDRTNAVMAEWIARQNPSPIHLGRHRVTLIRLATPRSFEGAYHVRFQTHSPYDCTAQVKDYQTIEEATKAYEDLCRQHGYKERGHAV